MSDGIRFILKTTFRIGNKVSKPEIQSFVFIIEPSMFNDKHGFSIRKKSMDLLSIVTGIVTPGTSPKPERATFAKYVF